MIEEDCSLLWFDVLLTYEVGMIIAVEFLALVEGFS